MEYDKFMIDLHNKYDKIFVRTPFIECESGWFSIIEELSEKLNEKAKQYSQGTITVAQIKHKFGGLRYYVDYAEGLPEEDIFDIEQLIRKYEELSYKVCELCGKEGHICARTAYLVATYCDECSDSLKKG